MQHTPKWSKPKCFIITKSSTGNKQVEMLMIIMMAFLGSTLVNSKYQLRWSEAKKGKKMKMMMMMERERKFFLSKTQPKLTSTLTLLVTLFCSSQFTLQPSVFFHCLTLLPLTAQIMLSYLYWFFLFINSFHPRNPLSAFLCSFYLSYSCFFAKWQEKWSKKQKKK